jgi:hypothetical protein
MEFALRDLTQIKPGSTLTAIHPAFRLYGPCSFLLWSAIRFTN